MTERYAYFGHQNSPAPIWVAAAIMVPLGVGVFLVRKERPVTGIAFAVGALLSALLNLPSPIDDLPLMTVWLLGVAADLLRAKDMRPLFKWATVALCHIAIAVLWVWVLSRPPRYAVELRDSELVLTWFSPSGDQPERVLAEGMEIHALGDKDRAWRSWTLYNKANREHSSGWATFDIFRDPSGKLIDGDELALRVAAWSGGTIKVEMR